MRVYLNPEAFKRSVTKTLSEISQDTGIHKSDLSKIIRGKRSIGPKLRKKLVEYTKIPPDQLFVWR